MQELELKKLAEALKASNKEKEDKEAVLAEKERVLGETLRSLEISDKDSAEKAERLEEKAQELRMLRERLEKAQNDIFCRDDELRAKELSLEELREEIKLARDEITTKTKLLLEKCEEIGRKEKKRMEKVKRKKGRGRMGILLNHFLQKVLSFSLCKDCCTT